MLGGSEGQNRSVGKSDVQKLRQNSKQRSRSAAPPPITIPTPPPNLSHALERGRRRSEVSGRRRGRRLGGRAPVPLPAPASTTPTPHAPPSVLNRPKEALLNGSELQSAGA